MDNIENILDELNDFDKQKTAEIPKALEDYINHLAKTGDTVFPWQKIKGVIRHKLEVVINNFKEICPTESLPPCPNVEPFNYETMRDKIFEQFDSFTCAPFTIQRLCELLCAPRKHYKRTDKFMRGVEKNLLVVSTIDPGQRKRSESVSSQSLINGVIESGTATTRAAVSVSTTNNRASSVASDAVSISDADSGISDTEDEEKSSEKVSQPAVSETTGKPEEATETSAPEPVVDMTTEPSTDTNDETKHPVPTTQAEQSADECKPEEVAPVASSDDDAAMSIEQHVPTEAEGPAAPTEPAKPSTGSETPTSDKKRPLEDDEDDQEPGAKQPRMYSPDKVVEESHSAPGNETKQNVESPAAAEQEPAEHNTPGAEAVAPAAAESDCQESK